MRIEWKKISALLVFLTAIAVNSSCSQEIDLNQSPTLRVMTFNIRFDNPKDSLNAWPNRKERVANLIRFYDTDLLGVQEALHHQMTDLADRLPGYNWIGVGRDDGKREGEYSGIFYRLSRFELQDTGTFWLSETPEEKGSIGWDAACVRIVTWTKFIDRTSEKAFFLFNTHFDHRGQQARIESATLIKEKVQIISSGLPAILTGDFNTTDNTDTYKILTGARDNSENIKSLFRDAWVESELPPFGPLSTFNGFGRSMGNRRIDFIFVSDHWYVKRHGVISAQIDGLYPSDHMPVLADLIIQSAK